MTRPTSFALAALVAAAMIGTGLATPAVSQDQGHGPRDHWQMGGGQHDGRFERHDFRRGPGPMGGAMMMRGMGPGGLLALVCSDRGADRLEHLLLSVMQRVDPTAAQQSLYDAFQSAAMTAQTDFATACADARPAKAEAQDSSAAKPDLADRLKARLDIEKAHVDAMTKVLPAFEAFYDSLTDAQKQALEPRRGDFQARMLDRRPHGHGPGMEQPAPAGVEPAPMNG
jgi:hypothetical protein